MLNHLQKIPPDRWLRSPNGYVAGVCEGFGRKFGIDPWIMRLFWLVSIAAFGSGLVLYFVLAICLPRADMVTAAYRRRLFGACVNLSLRTGYEVGLVRTLTVLAGLASFGITALIYIGMSVAIRRRASREAATAVTAASSRPFGS